MLAVLLYTGCDCYGDLRASERRGDYDKWSKLGFGLFVVTPRFGKRQTHDVITTIEEAKVG